ncbi:site-specific recombinase XerD [Cupriavidus agavae]|uniref:Site-specific recombinase XerD n=2 Tax=Cupriavidus agavae TaxID=1001822 RepID=A0A4Q7RYE2_9BURK|nr:site-specific recombinase XerD [Cupriavidus agavae]
MAKTALSPSCQQERRDPVLRQLIRITGKSGAESYSVRLGRRYGRKRVSIGDSRALTIDQARIEALRILSDPHGARTPLVNRLFSEWQDIAIANRKRSQKLDHTRFARYVEPYIGSVCVDSVTSEQVSTILVAASQTVADATRNRVLSLIKALFNFAVQRGYATKNPAHSFKSLQEVPRTIPEATPHLYLAVTKAIWILRKDAPLAGALVELLTLTGMRLNEARTLQWQQVDFTLGQVRLERTKAKPRFVPLNPNAQALLQSLQQQGVASAFVFPGKDGGKPMAIPHRRVKAAYQAAGLPADFCFHSLRHLFGKMAVGAGASPFEVKGLLGHSSLRMTERYAAASHEALALASRRSVAAFAAAAATAGAEL